MRERVTRLEQAITEAVKLASPALQQVINDLQALRGIAEISAVTIAAELGQISRFDSARQLMGYCGTVPSEDSSGRRTRRGSITKTGNAHLRRIVVEAAWSYHRPPCIWYGLRKRQEIGEDGLHAGEPTRPARPAPRWNGDALCRNP